MKQIFGSNLRRLRTAHNYSQTKLATLTGLDQQQISDYEKGIHMPRPGKIDKLCKALDCEVSDLFTTMDAKKELDYIKTIQRLEQEIERLKKE